MFSKLLGRKSDRKPVFAYAMLNARIMPDARGELFEDPLDEALKQNGLGEVPGAGTLQQATGEIEYCGIDIDLFDVEKAATFICEFLTEAGAPRGSELQINPEGENRKVPFGQMEGLAIYLNGTDLPDEVYRDCDINHVVEMLTDATQAKAGGEGTMLGHWQGPTETALYFGSSGNSGVGIW